MTLEHPAVPFVKHVLLFGHVKQPLFRPPPDVTEIGAECGKNGANVANPLELRRKSARTGNCGAFKTRLF
jgi:hypothetical protein